MNDEERTRVVTNMVRSMLTDIVFDSKNAMAFMLMVVHDVTAEELEGKISSILRYLERTKEGKN